MANALYDKGRQGFLDGSIDWDSDNIKVSIVNSAVYTPDLANDEFFSDIASVIATSSNLSGKSAVDGVARADDIIFATVSGAQSEYLVIWQDTGNPATSRLIALIDTASGLPVTPAGGPITLAWDVGANGIFTL